MTNTEFKDNDINNLNVAEEPQFRFNFANNEVTDDGSLRVLSLFSGCGGMDLGFEGGFICHRKSVANNEWIDNNVGSNWVRLKKNLFKTVFANDILPEARNAWINFMNKFGTNPEIYHPESIVDLVKMNKETGDVFPKNIDVVTGGFPCQDFSVAGKRNGFNSQVSHNGEKISEPTEESRGKLYMWMKEVVSSVQPKIFIAENVKGLVSLGDVKKIIQHDFSTANGNDYIVLDPQVLHAGNYGVPETRERVIFIGIKRSALKPEALKALEQDVIPMEYYPYPNPTHNFSAQNDTLANPVICKDIFEELEEPEISKDPSQQTFSKAKFMTSGQGQSEININGLGPTIRSEHHGNIEFRRLSIEHGGKNLEEINKGLKERRLTPRECALIQTFPPDYDFVFSSSKGKGVSASGAYKVIGNAVPPVLAYNIARRIQELWPLYFK